MQNPQLSTYSVKELFTLKPASVKLDAVPMKPEFTSKMDINLNSPDPAPVYPGFLSKYKWIIIGGVVVVGGICWYVYKKNQKDNSTQAN